MRSRTALAVAGIGGVGFFAMSMLVLGVWPGRALDRETRRTSPAHPLRLTASEERGRTIYGREGCAYCHTQQVRSVDADVARFGPTTAVWETQFDYPHLWGTRRIGPDLSRENGLHSEDWQLAHLYSPRAIVPDSVMPAFAAMFDGAADRPLQAARDVVAYIESLGRARALAEPVTAAGRAPLVLREVAKSARGEEVYAHNCAGCHGEKGEGDGPGAAGLQPRPANLSGHDYATERMARVFAGGVRGTAMPAWRDLPPDDLSAVAATVRGFYSAVPEPALPRDIESLGEQVYRDRCAQCHGDGGAGDGPAAPELRTAPTDFTRERPTVAESLRALRNGVEGTPMAPWNTKLSEADLSAVAYFVRRFYR